LECSSTIGAILTGEGDFLGGRETMVSETLGPLLARGGRAENLGSVVFDPFGLGVEFGFAARSSVFEAEDLVLELGDACIRLFEGVGLLGQDLLQLDH
jgi:hypothetical protein